MDPLLVRSVPEEPLRKWIARSVPEIDFEALFVKVTAELNSIPPFPSIVPLLIRFVLTLLLKVIIFPPEVEPVMLPLFVKFSIEMELPLDPAFTTVLVLERVTPELITKSSPLVTTTVELVFAEITWALTEVLKEA